MENPLTVSDKMQRDTKVCNTNAIQGGAGVT